MNPLEIQTTQFNQLPIRCKSLDINTNGKSINLLTKKRHRSSLDYTIQSNVGVGLNFLKSDSMSTIHSDEDYLKNIHLSNVNTKKYKITNLCDNNQKEDLSLNHQNLNSPQLLDCDLNRIHNSQSKSSEHSHSSNLPDNLINSTNENLYSPLNNVDKPPKSNKLFSNALTNSNDSQKDGNTSNHENENEKEQSIGSELTTAAYNYFVRRVVDDTLDRTITFCEQPRQAISTLENICARAWPQLEIKRHRNRIRAYLKACRRNSKKNKGQINMKDPPTNGLSIEARHLVNAALNLVADDMDYLKQCLKSDYNKNKSFNNSPKTENISTTLTNNNHKSMSGSNLKLSHQIKPDQNIPNEMQKIDNFSSNDFQTEKTKLNNFPWYNSHEIYSNVTDNNTYNMSINNINNNNNNNNNNGNNNILPFLYDPMFWTNTFQTNQSMDPNYLTTLLRLSNNFSSNLLYGSSITSTNDNENHSNKKRGLTEFQTNYSTENILSNNSHLNTDDSCTKFQNPHLDFINNTNSVSNKPLNSRLPPQIGNKRSYSSQINNHHNKSYKNELYPDTLSSCPPPPAHLNSMQYSPTINHAMNRLTDTNVLTQDDMTFFKQNLEITKIAIKHARGVSRLILKKIELLENQIKTNYTNLGSTPLNLS